jgi:uncharacterized phage protein (TIGR01671 family)
MIVGGNVVTAPDDTSAVEKYDGRRELQNLRFYSPVDDECILMQFTGIIDKNGREIYEGDIVRWDHGADEQDRGVDAVEFLAGAFCLTEPGRYRLDAFCHNFSNQLSKDLEVIGNLYENPGLLKAAKKSLRDSAYDDREQRAS